MKYKLGDTIRISIAPVLTQEYLAKSWEWEMYRVRTGMYHPDAPLPYKDLQLTTHEMVDLANEGLLR